MFTPALRMVVCIPSGITEVEMRAVKESCERVNGKVYLIHEPMAAAIGIGIDIMQPKGNMIVDIGGTTEIAVILGGIVCDKSVRLQVTFSQMICILHAYPTQSICGRKYS
jgi:rod shape-determining protein MreB